MPRDAGSKRGPEQLGSARVFEHDEPAGMLAQRKPRRTHETRGERRDHVPPKLWQRFEQRLEFRPVENEQLHALQRTSRCGGGTLGQQRHLADRLTRMGGVDDVLDSLPIGKHDLDGSRAYHVHLLAVLALRHDHRPAG